MVKKLERIFKNIEKVGMRAVDYLGEKAFRFPEGQGGQFVR